MTIKDSIMKNFNDYLNNFQTEITRKNPQKADEFMKEAIKLAKGAIKSNRYNNTKFKRFVADGFLEAAKVADRSETLGLVKNPLREAMRYTTELEVRIPNSEYKKIENYTRLPKTGSLQNLNIRGITYSDSQAEDLRFNAQKEEYFGNVDEKQRIRPKKKISEEDIEKTAQTYWDKCTK
jgi:hypothetical protein